MALNFNNTNITGIVFNGTNLTNVIYNGVEVWTSKVPDTTLPNVNYEAMGSDYDDTGIHQYNFNIDGTKYSSISFNYNIDIWSGDGFTEIGFYKQNGTKIYKIGYGSADNCDKKTSSGTLTVQLPSELVTCKTACKQDDSGGSRISMTNIILRGR